MYTDAYKAKGMEIIFASSDKDQSSFDEYYGEQPWLALPFSARGIKEKLSKQYKVRHRRHRHHRCRPDVARLSRPVSPASFPPTLSNARFSRSKIRRARIFCTEPATPSEQVTGIPSFVIIAPDGSTITTDGRAAVSGDPTGEKSAPPQPEHSPTAPRPHLSTFRRLPSLVHSRHDALPH